MNIQGFAKLTLLDYPGKVACTVFTGGCNLRCPFCHNAGLVLAPNEGENTPESEIFDYLKKRRGIIEGVCITGGEPLIQKDIGEFIKELKKLDVLVKLDTNGCYPQLLENLITSGLVDYVAMDIKNSPEKYAKTVGVPNFDITPILKSVEILAQNRIPYEFRTTVTAEFHVIDDFKAIGKWLPSDCNYFLQNFVDSGNLIGENISGYTAGEMKDFLAAVSKFVKNTQLRGV
jgi:pyruvate formate lyase activating enzyme